MATTIDPTGLDSISLACDSDGGLIREGRILRAALECAEARVAELEAEAERLRRERDDARAAACRLLTRGQAVVSAPDGEYIMRALAEWQALVQVVRLKHAWFS